LANLIGRIGPWNHGTTVSHKFFSFCGSESYFSHPPIYLNQIFEGHELQNYCYVHLPLPPAPLKMFCQLSIKIGSWVWWLISKRLLHPLLFILKTL
jgi:hypothetical protein